MAAETFGIVAGALTIVEVTAKLGRQVSRAQQLWENAKDAPETVKSLMNRICLFQLSLSQLEADFASLKPELYGKAPSMGSVTSVYCRTALNELSASLDELSVEVNSKKKLKRGAAKMKIAFKKDLWVEQERRLTTAVQMLDLAQNWYMCDLMRQQPDRTVSLLKTEMMTWAGSQNDPAVSPAGEVDEPATHTTGGNRATSRHQSSVMEKWLRPSFFGALTWTFSSTSASDKQSLDHLERQTELAFQIRSPRWISYKAWDILARNSFSGFDFHSRVYSVVPFEAPVFECIKKGNVRGIQQLFSKGLASPFDRNPVGATLLQVAFSSEHFQVESIPMLIRCGLDLREVFGNTGSRPPHYWPFWWILYPLWEGYSLERMRAFHNLAVAEGAYEEVSECVAEGATRGWWPNLFWGLERNPVARQLVLPYIRPGHYQLPAKDRLLFFFTSSPGIPANVDSIRWALRQDGVLKVADVQELDSQGISLLKFIAMFCKYYQPGINSLEQVIQECRDLTRDIITMTEHPHSRAKLPISIRRLEIQLSRRSPPVTPFMSIIFDEPDMICKCQCWVRWRRCMEGALRRWLEDVARSGLDLLEYGREEKRLFLEMEPTYCGAWVDSHYIKLFRSKSILRVKGFWRLEDFTYGPKPEDWRFSWDLDVERLVGNFWDMIENLPPNIPGSWTDEAEGDDFSASESSLKTESESEEDAGLMTDRIAYPEGALSL